MYKCCICHCNTDSFTNVVNHQIENHPHDFIRIKVKTLSPTSGQFVYKTRHYNVKPIEKSIEIIEPESLIAYPNSTNSPEPKRRFEDLNDFDEYDTSETDSVLSDMTAENSDWNECDEIYQMLPKVIKELKRSNQYGDFKSFLRLVSEERFPNKNIAYLLFLDVCRFLSQENTVTMRYSKEVKEFWKIGYQLFHGKFLRFAMGYKNIGQIIEGSTLFRHYDPSSANINFAVPSLSALLLDQSSLPLPGIFMEMIDRVKGNDSHSVLKSYKICVDGKKIIHAPEDEKSEIDLFGFEEPSKAQRLDRLRSEELLIDELLSDVRNLADSSTEDTNMPVSEKVTLCNKLQDLIRILSLRLKDLREIKIKKEGLRQRLRDTAGPNWQKSKYAIVISAVSVHLLKMDETVQSLMETVDGISESLAKINGCNFQHGRAATRLGENSSYTCILEDSLSKEYPAVLKQRTAEWHSLRRKSKITGSTMYDALGLESLKKQKEHYEKVMNGIETEGVTDEATHRRMMYGCEHEIDGVATLVSKILPVWFPALSYFEEGCYPITNDQNHFATISPDGSLRDSKGEASLAIEIKCPFPNSYRVPVQYRIPTRYVLQLLSEMHALGVKKLLYLSYSLESTAVHEVTFDDELWQRGWCEAVRLYSSESSSKPTKRSPEVPKLRQMMERFLDTNVHFLGEVMSSIAIQCRTSDHDIEDEGRGYHGLNLGDDKPRSIMSLQKLENIIFRAGNTIRDCNNLTKTVASEVLVYIMTYLDRIYQEEIPHAIPIAYGLKGFSLTADVLRKTLQHILLACHTKGLYIPVVSFDGQWQKLAVRDAENHPLTKLQLQKDVWKSAQEKSKQDILKEMTAFGARNSLFVDNCVKVYIVEKRNGKIFVERNPECPYRPFCTSVDVLKAIYTKQNNTLERQEGSYRSEINDICSILIQENKEIPSDDVLMKRTDDDSNSVSRKEYLDDINTLCAATKHNTERTPPPPSERAENETILETHSIDSVLNALRESETDRQRRKWSNMSAEQYKDKFVSTEMISRTHTKKELVLLNDTLCSLGYPVSRIYGSWTKKRIAQELYASLQNQVICRSVTKNKKPSNTRSLKLLSLTILKKIPKLALSVAYAEHIWPLKLSDWYKRSPIVNGNCIVGINENIEWYSMPEYDSCRKMYQFSILDPYHLMTNARVTVCSRGLEKAGVHRGSFIKVAKLCKDSGVGLSIPMVEEIIDKQNIAFALTTFSSAVADELRRQGDQSSAEFCDLIRNWYSSEDDPGIQALERIKSRLALREWLLRGVNFSSFPPSGNTVKDLPITMFEGLMTNIERRIQIYPFLPAGSFNTRALGSLDAETFFSGFQDLDPKGTGILRPGSIPKAMRVANDIISAKLNTERTFCLRTSKKTVYPVKKPTGDCIGFQATTSSWTQPTVVTLISPRDHVFDLPERRRTKRRRKIGTVSGPDKPGRGAMPIRQYHKRDETKIMPHKRAGLSLDF